MKAFAKLILASVLLGTALPACAQEIVVTGSRREADDYDASMPIITLRRTADFAIREVTISGDTRDADKRHDEIYAMIRGAIELAPKYGVELATGEYIVEPLTLANYRNLPLVDDRRPDTNKTSFSVKVRLEPGMDAKAALARIERFIKAVPAVGRAQMEPSGDLTLSVVNPDQYRGTIIDLIAADAAATAAKFGPDYGVEVKGLDRPVEWARASLTEVFLFLPAAYVVRPKE
ncbi:MAG: TonB-dependent receptor [Pseudomonadota bacterium]